MIRTLTVALVVGLSTGLGAIPFAFVRELPRRIYDMILGVGAGLMLSAATLGLLTEALDGVRASDRPIGALAVVVAGFVAGIVALMLLDRIVPHRHAGGHREHLSDGDKHTDAEHVHPAPAVERASQASARRQGYLVMSAMTLHRVPEGFAIGVALSGVGSAALGWVLAVAVALQNACEGAVMAAPLVLGGLSKRRMLPLVAATGLVLPIAAIGGALFAREATGLLSFALAVAAGALIYLTSNEVIPESHSHGHEAAASLGLVGGFLVTMVVQSVFGHR
jgi:ZIP family zinc transporter